MLIKALKNQHWQKIIKIHVFNTQFLSSISQITLNPEQIEDKHLPTKYYVDSLSENNGNRRDLSKVFNNQKNDFDSIKLKNLNNQAVTRNPILNEEVSNKINVDTELDKEIVLRYMQSLQNYICFC